MKKEEYEKAIENWGYSHFVLFLYIYIAYADNIVDEDEWKLIKEKFGTIAPEENYMDTFLEVASLYEKCNDYFVLEVIDVLKSKLGLTVELKEKLMKDIHEIKISDRTVQPEETEIELIIKKVLR